MRIGLPFLRHLSRLGVVTVFCVLPWLNAAGVHGISGSLFALDVFGWPFGDPAALLQALTTGERPASRLLLGAGCSLALAFFLGRVFCGWICPYGLLSEGMAAFRMKPHTEYVSGRKECGSRVVVLAAALVVAALGGYPALTLLSFPGALSLAPLIAHLDGFGIQLFELLVIPAGVLLLEYVLGERLWCRFVCPQGLLLGCAALLGSVCRQRGVGRTLSVQWNPASCSCKGEAPCGVVCSLRVQPRRKDGPDALRCSRCGDCVSVCTRKGKALSWKC